MFHLVPDELAGEDATATVVFKWLQDEPLFLLTGKPERVQEYIESFDLGELLSSWWLDFYLEAALEGETSVTNVEILEVLGGPSSRVTQASVTCRVERWEYARYRLVLYFQQSILVTVVTY